MKRGTLELAAYTALAGLGFFAYPLFPTADARDAFILIHIPIFCFGVISLLACIPTRKK